jgi:chromosome segregation ATPase
MTDRELLEQIVSKISDMDAKMSSMDTKISGMDSRISGIELTVSGIDKRLSNIDDRLKRVEEDVKNIDHRTILIENEHVEKLSALFDGYKQHSEQLDRIEKAVVEHDEILFRRVK